MADKKIGLFAYNAGIVTANAAYTGARAIKTAVTTTAQAAGDASVGFWAGLKFAVKANHEHGTTVSTLSSDDIAPAKPRVRRALASGKR